MIEVNPIKFVNTKKFGVLAVHSKNVGGLTYVGRWISTSSLKDAPKDKDLLMDMPLRDYFAAMAMQPMFEVWEDFEDWGFEELAMRSYEMADAMLKAREK